MTGRFVEWKETEAQTKTANTRPVCIRMDQENEYIDNTVGGL